MIPADQPADAHRAPAGAAVHPEGAGAETVVRVICGPTAAGKTALAMALAERGAIAVISADSRQIYRGFDIGTAKPSPGERARVPHYGLDVADPAERYSAARWAGEVPGWMAAVRAAGREPLLVGGTGFYLRALFDPLFEEPPLEPARRRALAAWMRELPVPELRRWCEVLDPDRAHLGRAQLERAIEIALLSGQRLSVLHRRRARAAALRARYLVVDPGRALAGAIEARVDAMLAAGWIQEARRLLASVPPDAPAWTATGYDAVRQVVTGKWSLAEAREAIVIRTRQYAKRQRTWFRHQLQGSEVTRLDPARPDVLEQVERWWHGEE